MKRIAVYCGSATPENQIYVNVAREIGKALARRGIGVVYGGGRLGLMGAVADSALEAGGEVIGIIPEALVGAEVAHRGCTELHVVENMHERKRIMAEHADAFLALPGGIGTMEEFFEVWTWRQLGYHNKPVGLLNMDGFYDSLLTFLNSAVSSGFMNEWQMDLIRTGTDAPLLMQELVQAAGSKAPTLLLDQI